VFESPQALQSLAWQAAWSLTKFWPLAATRSKPRALLACRSSRAWPATTLLPFTRLVIGAASRARSIYIAAWPASLAIGAAGACLAIHLGFFISQAPGFAQPRPLADLQRRTCKRTLPRQQSAHGIWPVGWINYLWFDLGVPSYFDDMQIAGTFSAAPRHRRQRRAGSSSASRSSACATGSTLYSPLQLHICRVVWCDAR